MEYGIWTVVLMMKWLKYTVLLFVIAIYSTVGILTRSAALYPFLSWPYVAFVLGAICVLALYAIIWQQIIQRMNISLAYMFKGLGVVFTLLICHYVFDEIITLKNLLGGTIIIAGITLFAYADKKEDVQ